MDKLVNCEIYCSMTRKLLLYCWKFETQILFKYLMLLNSSSHYFRKNVICYYVIIFYQVHWSEAFVLDSISIQRLMHVIRQACQNTHPTKKLMQSSARKKEGSSYTHDYLTLKVLSEVYGLEWFTGWKFSITNNHQVILLEYCYYP